MTRQHIFDGDTFEPAKDTKRLSSQFARVLNVMRDGRERTINDIHELTGDPHQSITSRLRDCNKERFKVPHGIEKMKPRRIGGGLWVYRVYMKEGME